MTSAARQIRRYRNIKQLSLKNLAEASGISASQLSKIETGKAKLTIETAMKLAEILQVPAANFLMEPAPKAMARRTITRQNTGTLQQSPGMRLEVLCAEFKEKHNLFWKVQISAGDLEENGGWRHHPGQEFLHVLSGTLRLLSMYYDPVDLSEGDSILFDADQPHAYLGVNGPAEVIMVNTVQPTP
jgi:transcriptional regulator with XRE-family HTH domain